jgi:hypothetical protein
LTESARLLQQDPSEYHPAVLFRVFFLSTFFRQVQATSAKEAKPFVAPAARRRVKKGAKRVNKLAAIARKTLADLDKEIEEYKAAEGL